MRVIILLALTLAASPCPAMAQERDPCLAKASPFHPVGEGKPTVYITFERVEKQNVLLRLHNTSRWAVMVPVDKFYLARPVRLKLCTGVRTYALKNGSRVNLKYEVEGGERYPEPLTGGQSETRLAMALPAGRSLIFPVSRRHLSRDLRIYVPFVYEFDVKETGDAGGARESTAYLSSEELSKALRGK